MGQRVTISDFRRICLPLLAGILCTFTFLPGVLFSQIGVNIVPTHVSCFGGSNGAATATANGGAAPYTFVWSNGSTGATITNRPAGTYSVTATSSNGLTGTATVQINQPTQLQVSVSGQSQICDVVPDGTATAFPSGGTPPYTYLWNNGQTTSQILHLPAGTYTVTTTDLNGCTAAASTVIEFFDEGLWISIAISAEITCFGANNGQATAMVMTGTAPYTYVWSNGSTTTTSNMSNTIANLPPGTYSVTVTDVNGCFHSLSVTLSQPPELFASASGTNATCGTNTGSATATAFGGTPPYSILWNNGQTSFTISNLAAGTYTATVTDSKGCQKPVSATVTAVGSNLSLSTAVIKAASCNSGGTASVNVFNGSGNYTYTWDNGQTTQTATNLTVGNHTVTVVDVNTGCSNTAMVNIPTAGTPSVSVGIVQQATCTTGGSATANPVGGLAPYTYLWDNGQTTQTATNLSSGTHSVTVTDNGGCIVIGQIIITTPTAPNVSVSVLSNATCTSGGSAVANPTGGTSPYFFFWSNGQTTQTATNLPVGINTVTVTDNAGCSKTANVTITQTQGPQASATQTAQATCTTGGMAMASATGGTPPYSFLWDNGQTTAGATGLSVGLHNVTVTDAGNCTAVASVNITKTPSPTVTATVTTQATCTTGGTATASASGGTAPYTFKWDNNQMTATATNLSGGIHTVTVTDVNGCTGTATVNITQIQNPTVTITASSNANCSQPGSATAVAAGGTGPYTFKWDNNEMTATASNLNPGPHSVTVTDANGCTASASVTINQTNNGIKIGDYVWIDIDQDGFQHPTETQGVPNIQVQLIRPGNDGVFGTPDDVIVKTATTNASGLYQMDCVTPGTYILMFNGLPNGMEWTQKNAVANDCKDSDVNANGKTDPFTIVAGQPDNFCFDAGIHEVCNNVTMAGTVAADQIICEGDTPAPLYQVMPPAGGNGAIEFLWLQLVGSGSQATWVGIPNSNTPGLTLGPLFVTSHFMRCVRRAGCVNFLESNIVTITVKPAGSPGCGPFLLGFTATSLAKHAVQLDWKTKPEAVPYMYEVQHSTDKNYWSQISEVMGNQDAAAPNTYQAMHEHPSTGKNFYRIKRTDADNRSAFSQEIELDMEIPIEESISILPNPVQDEIVVKNALIFDYDVNIQISAVNGAVVYDFNIPAGEAAIIKNDMRHLAAGIYFARIRFGKGDVRTLKILKY